MTDAPQPSLLDPCDKDSVDKPGSMAILDVGVDRDIALARYDILDTPTERDFDDLARLASEALNAPIAVINFVASARQWFKAEIGIGTRELPLDVSICAHALLQDEMMVIPDTRLDPRLDGNRLVTAENGLRFYAGALLKTPEGVPIGTVCVLDHIPRPQGITAFQRLTLEVLARQVMTQLELRRALCVQREAEHRNRLILDSALDYGIVTLDLAGMVTSWNLGASRLMGWTQDEICGQPCDTFFTPEDQAAGIPAREMTAAATQERGVDERWHVRKDGSRFWGSGEMMPLTADNGEHVGYLKILRDRTARHQAVAELAASEARTRLALEAGQLGAWESTPSLEVMTWDARTREILGHTPDEALDYDLSFMARVHPEDRDRIAAINAKALGPDGDGTTHMEYRTISAVDGRERWVQAKGALAKGANGERKFVGTVRDITAEKEADHHRQLLIAELQHRIKNTLAVVQSIVSQSLHKATTTEEARKAISDRLITLGSAHDLLVQTSWTAAPIAAIVKGATQLHGTDLSRMQIHGPDLLLSARAALALSMSLHELTTNASKYGALTDRGGHVELVWNLDMAADADTSEMTPMLNLRWQEYGGPAVTPPQRRGFGTRLLDALARDLGGKAAISYAPDGVVWQLTARLEDLVPPKVVP